MDDDQLVCSIHHEKRYVTVARGKVCGNMRLAMVNSTCASVCPAELQAPLAGALRLPHEEMAPRLVAPRVDFWYGCSVEKGAVAQKGKQPCR